jgi:hypothetical protein
MTPEVFKFPRFQMIADKPAYPQEGEGGRKETAAERQKGQHRRH